MEVEMECNYGLIHRPLHAEVFPLLFPLKSLPSPCPTVLGIEPRSLDSYEFSEKMKLPLSFFRSVDPIHPCHFSSFEK
jgi:hypothetical protein